MKRSIEIGAKNYKLDRVDICFLNSAVGFKVTFESIYKALLFYKLDECFLTDYKADRFVINGMYDEVINVIKEHHKSQIERGYKCLDLSEEIHSLLEQAYNNINKKVINGDFKIVESNKDKLVIDIKSKILAVV